MPAATSNATATTGITTAMAVLPVLLRPPELVSVLLPFPEFESAAGEDVVALADAAPEFPDTVEADTV